MAGLTANGFELKTLDEVLADIEASLRADIGPKINLQADSILWPIAAAFAAKITELWELALAVYSSQDPDKAVESMLDAVCALTGTVRAAASPSTSEVVCTGTPTTVLSEGRVVSVTGNALARFATDEAATLAAATAWAGTTTYALGEFVTNAGNIYCCTDPGVSAGSGGPATTSTAIVDDGVVWAYCGEGTGYEVVAVTCEDDGPTVANAYTLSVIETPVSGWEGVTNPLDAVLGSLEEGDTALRARRLSELEAVGSGTVDSILGRLLGLADVEDAIVSENTGDTTDGGGRPPHSVHAVVLGGETADIIQELWDAKGGGIETHGSVSGSATDAVGELHTVNFDRAVEKDVYLEVDISIDADTYPSDGDTQVQAALVTQGDSLTLGQDVIAGLLKSVVWQVSGVYDVTALRLGFAASPTGLVNLTIDADEIARFDTSRVLVTTTPVTP